LESVASEGRLPELGTVAWRPLVDEGYLRRWGRRWTAWTVCLATPLVGFGVLFLAIEPLAFPVTHAWVIPELYARRGTNAVRRSSRPEARADERAQGAALGLLADLVGHEAREVLRETGLVVERGRLGVWVVGGRGALLVRPGGRRVDCWCARVTEGGGLPAADRIAHLLLALREDETGFATVANLSFSGAAWRVRRRMPREMRPALDAARRKARQG
jgi:hypothetical protein